MDIAIPTRRITALLAPFIDAIAEARDTGRSWPEIHAVIGPIFGIDTPHGLRQAVGRAKRAIESGKIKIAQRALPSSRAEVDEPAEPVATSKPAAAPRSTPGARPTPAIGVPGRRVRFDKNLDEM